MRSDGVIALTSHFPMYLKLELIVAQIIRFHGVLVGEIELWVTNVSYPIEVTSINDETFAI